MPIGNWNLQWLNHNSQRAYPLTEAATKTATNAPLIKLPDSFIVALYLPIHSGLAFAPNNFFIKTVTISPVGFGITVGYRASNITTTVASASISKNAFTPNQAYALGGVGDFADCVGHIVLGTLDEIDALPPGMYEFSQEAGALETDAIRPMIRAVQRLRVYNNSEYSDPIYGDVTLVAGANIRINVATTAAETEITIHAISDADLNQNCFCDIPTVGECIRCINGVCSSDGTFTFAQDECIGIDTIPGGLSFSDTCASPCCGCTELDAITQQINRFGDGVTSLQNFVTRLNAEVAQMSFVVLANKIGSGGGC